MRRYFRYLAVFAAFALIAAACGDSSESEAETTVATQAAVATTVAVAEVQEVQQVYFILDWIPKGQTAPFFVALDKGFWAERGLAVQMTRGYGSGDTSTRVGIGEGEFGYADAGVVMNTITQGLPLIEIGAIASTAPTAAYIDPALGVTGPSDFVGLRGAVDAGDANDSLFQAYAPSVGISYDDVDWQYIDGANIGSIVSGQADFVMDWITNLPEWWLADPPVEPDVIWIGRAMDIYGNGLITRPEVLADDPELVRNFVEGAIAGYQYVIDGGIAAHNEAVDILFKYNPEIAEQPNAREFHLGNLQLFLTLMLTDDVRTNGLGYFDNDKKQRTLDFMNTWLLETPVELDTAFADIIDQGQVMISDFDAALASLETVLGRPNPLTPLLGP